MFWHIAVGAIVSAIVTTAIQLEVLPFTSVTVKVTLLGPTSEQLNTAGEELNPAIPQLSLDPPSISPAKTIAVPVPSRYAVIFWQTAVGAIVSEIVTIEIHVAIFPDPSVTVNVTLFGPISAHVNAVCDALNVTGPQLSTEPPSKSLDAIEAFPAPSKKTVMFWTIGRATGQAWGLHTGVAEA